MDIEGLTMRDQFLWEYDLRGTLIPLSRRLEYQEYTLQMVLHLMCTSHNYSLGPQNIMVGCSKNSAGRRKFIGSSQHPTIIFLGPTSLSNVMLKLWQEEEGKPTYEGIQNVRRASSLTCYWHLLVENFYLQFLSLKIKSFPMLICTWFLSDADGITKERLHVLLFVSLDMCVS